MKKIAALGLGFVLSGFAMAGTVSDEVTHVVTLTGIKQGEGRYIRADILEDDQYKFGYYFCATRRSVIFMDMFFADEVADIDAWKTNQRIRFSICQDENLSECQEFATDELTVFKNSDGLLETDAPHVSPISIEAVKDGFRACEPDMSKFDELKLMKQSFRSRKKFR